MGTNHEKDADAVLALREELRLKRKKLVDKLAQIDRELESADVVIRLLGIRDDTEQDEGISVSPRELHGMSQLDAVIHIAERNSNRVKVTLAKRLLSNAGLLKGSKKNWYNILTTTIKRSGCFTHVGPGEYEFVPEENPVVQMRKRAV
jgi:hypothetical protein